MEPTFTLVDRHENQDFKPITVQDRPSEYEKVAKLFADLLGKMQKSTPLDSREILTNSPSGLEIELSLMNSIADDLENSLKLYQGERDHPPKPLVVLENGFNLITEDEEIDIQAAISLTRSIQTHLYQNWMGAKGWRANALLAGLQSILTVEDRKRLGFDGEGVIDKLKKTLHLG